MQVILLRLSLILACLDDGVMGSICVSMMILSQTCAEQTVIATIKSDETLLKKPQK